MSFIIENIKKKLEVNLATDTLPTQCFSIIQCPHDGGTLIHNIKHKINIEQNVNLIVLFICFVNVMFKSYQMLKKFKVTIHLVKVYQMYPGRLLFNNTNFWMSAVKKQLS